MDGRLPDWEPPQHYWHPRQLAANAASLPEGADPCVYFGANATVDKYGCPCPVAGGSNAVETFLVAFGIGIHVIGSVGINVRELASIPATPPKVVTLSPTTNPAALINLTGHCLRYLATADRPKPTGDGSSAPRRGQSPDLRQADP